MDELEELADRINKAATTPATTERGDPWPDWLQPFDENLVNNEGEQAAAPFAPSSAAAAPTMPDDDDELMVDEEVVKEHDPEKHHGDSKIIKVHDPKLPTEEEVRQHLMCHLPYRRGEDESVTIEDGLKITSRGSQSTTWTIAFPGTRWVNG